MDDIKKTISGTFMENNHIQQDYFDKYNVKRGLRNPDGTGVMAGITNICNVHGYVVDDGEKKPAEGRLTFRGYNVCDLIDGAESEDRFGYEEVVYLLLTGRLPYENELEEFTDLLSKKRELPDAFFEDMILKAPSGNIMNKMARSTLALYSYDREPELMTPEHEIDTAISQYCFKACDEKFPERAGKMGKSIIQRAVNSGEHSFDITSGQEIYS